MRLHYIPHIIKLCKKLFDVHHYSVPDFWFTFLNGWGNFHISKCDLQCSKGSGWCGILLESKESKENILKDGNFFLEKHKSSFDKTFMILLVQIVF